MPEGRTPPGWAEAVEVELWLTAEEARHDIVVAFKVPIRCPQCWGSGRSADKPCPTCRGWCMIDGNDQMLTAPIAAASFYDGIEYFLGPGTKTRPGIKITVRVEPDEQRFKPPWQFPQLSYRRT